MYRLNQILTFFFDLSDFLEMFFTFVWRWYKTLRGKKGAIY